MADLTDIQASGSTKIIGSDSTGIETTPVGSSANGELQISDISNNGGVNGSITVGITAVEAKVGGSVLANRKTISIFHTGGGKLYYGLSNSVTTSNGIQIFKNTERPFAFGPNTHLWLISDTAGQVINIVEVA